MLNVRCFDQYDKTLQEIGRSCFDNAKDIVIIGSAVAAVFMFGFALANCLRRELPWPGRAANVITFGPFKWERTREWDQPKVEVQIQNEHHHTVQIEEITEHPRKVLPN